MKYLQSYDHLKILDLSDNDLGTKGTFDVCELITGSKTIEELNLRGNRITYEGLQHLCSALSVNEGIVTIDISDNLFLD